MTRSKIFAAKHLLPPYALLCNLEELQFQLFLSVLVHFVPLIGWLAETCTYDGNVNSKVNIQEQVEARWVVKFQGHA
jgi:hypothetical protein